MTRRPGAGRPGEEGLVGRWSRLKRARQAGEPPAASEPPGEAAPPAGAESGAGVEDERPDEEILAELGLPDPETLGPDDDFSAFLKARLPERLRLRVLRRLWRVDPVLANLDELLDYGEDFTDAAMSAGVVQTVYRVGRGMVSKLDEEEGRAADGEPDVAEPATSDEARAEPSGGDPGAGQGGEGTSREKAAGGPEGEAPSEVAGAGGKGREAAPESAAAEAGNPPGEGASRAPVARRPRIRFRVPES